MLRVRVLGELELEVDGEPVAPPRGRGARGLLAWLALNPGAHARSDLAGRFWPDVLESSARTSLRGALAELTRALGPAAPACLAATRDRIALRPEAVVVDLAVWEGLAGAGREEEALALERGELLSGFDDEWVYVARDRHRARALDAVERLAEAAQARGDLAEAVRRTREQAAREPHSEEVHRRLMRRLDAAGDRATALLAYARLRERLAADLGTAPAPETRELADALRAPAARTPAPSPLPPVLAALDATPFVAREDQLAHLERAWAAVRTGATRVVLLAGDPGIGKTRTAARFCARVRDDGGEVLFGRVSEEAVVPYQPFAEALARIAGGDGEPLAGWAAADARELARIVPGVAARLPGLEPPVAGDPRGERPRLFAAVAGTLAALAARGPVVLVLDDLHWADAPVLLLIEHLARAGSGRLLVLGTYRRAELGVNRRLAETIEDLRRDRLLTLVALDGLDDGAVGALIAASTGSPPPARFAAAVQQHTAGNPFFVEEVLRRLATRPDGECDPDGWPSEAGIASLGIPRGVRELIGRRLERLDGPVLTLLETASVLGRRFELAPLALLCGAEEEAVAARLEEAARHRVVTEEEPAGRWVFHHQLVCDVAYARLLPGRRVRLHAAAARALESGGDARRLADLARHHARAGDPLRACEAAARAGAQARRLLAYEEAAELFAQAIATGPPAGRHAELLLALADARDQAGERAAARTASEEAAVAARAAGDPLALARAALGVAGRRIVRFGVADDRESALLEEALGALAAETRGDALDRAGRAAAGREPAALPPAEARETAALRARLLARRAEAFHAAGSATAGEEAERLGEQALAHARVSGDPEARAAALQARLWLLWAPGRARERIAVAGELIAATDAPAWRAEALAWRIAARLERSDLAGAAADADAYAALAATLRNPRNDRYAEAFATMRALVDGRLDDADAQLAAAAQAGAGEAAEADVSLAYTIQLMTLRLHQGRAGEAAAQIDDVLARFPGALGWRAARAMALAHADRATEARAELDALADGGFALFPRDGNWLPTLATLTHAAVATGSAGHAASLARALTPYSEASIAVFWLVWWGPVAHYQGLLAELLGERDAAAGHFARAAATASRAGAPAWAAQARGAAARARR